MTSWSGKRGSNPRHPPWQNGSVSRRPPEPIGDDRPSSGGLQLAGRRRQSPAVVWVADELSMNCEAADNAMLGTRLPKLPPMPHVVS